MKIKLLTIPVNLYTERFLKDLHEVIITRLEHLRKIRESYKSIALETNPDNRGLWEELSELNDRNQIINLKQLYQYSHTRLKKSLILSLEKDR